MGNNLEKLYMKFPVKKLFICVFKEFIWIFLHHINRYLFVFLEISSEMKVVAIPLMKC